MLVYGKCECFAMQMLYVCVLCASCGSSQFCVGALLDRPCMVFHIMCVLCMWSQ